MARITRKELKSDKFAVEVEHTFAFFGEHRQEAVRYGIIAGAVIVLVLGYMLFANRQHAAREQALTKAIEVAYAPVTPTSTGGVTFPTQAAKDQQVAKVFTDLASKYDGSEVGDIAQYYLGSVRADEGDLAGAEKFFNQAAQKGDAKYSSLAKLSLAQIYFATGRADQGQKMLQDLIDHPTIFVSHDQATVALARQLMATKPAEARKLIQPLLAKPGNVGAVAAGLNTEIPQ